MKNIYQSTIDEFLLSPECRMPNCAEKCINWFDKDKFATLSEEIQKEPIKYIAVSEQELISDIDTNIGMFIDYFEKTIDDRDNSVMNHMVSVINEEYGSTDLFKDYPGRSKGVLFEDILARALFTEDSAENAKLIKLTIASKVIKDIMSWFKNWIESPAKPNEKYKLIISYKNSLPESSTKFFLDVYNLIGGAEFIEKIELVSKTDPERLSRVLAVENQNLVSLAKKNKDDVLKAVHSAMGKNTEGMGVFQYISKHPLVNQTLLSQSENQNKNKEVLVAKIFSSENKNGEYNYFEAVWPLLGAWAVKAVCEDAYSSIKQQKPSAVL